MNSGERRVISSVALEAEDLDTPPNQVYYFLNAEPRFGKLQLKVRQIRSESTGTRAARIREERVSPPQLVQICKSFL